ncbi:MAG: AtpZ/AtpI family protein [Chloroflexi bacterium]|nr:AtpZ/AtpI family protein [Chloroflexota bacterium]
MPSRRARDRPQTRSASLVYSRGLGRWQVIEPGRGWAYFALFSEIGLLLLATTLIGVLAGYWVGQQIGLVPIFVVIGLALGLAVGGVGVYRLITRFLASFDD